MKQLKKEMDERKTLMSRLDEERVRHEAELREKNHLINTLQQQQPQQGQSHSPLFHPRLEILSSYPK
jgi:hypothetical protein